MRRSLLVGVVLAGPLAGCMPEASNGRSIADDLVPRACASSASLTFTVVPAPGDANDPHGAGGRSHGATEQRELPHEKRRGEERRMEQQRGGAAGNSTGGRFAPGEIDALARLRMLRPPLHRR